MTLIFLPTLYYLPVSGDIGKNFHEDSLGIPFLFRLIPTFLS